MAMMLHGIERLKKFPLINAHSPFYKNQVKELIGFAHLISNFLVTKKKKLKEIGFRDKDISINHLSIDTDQMQPVNKNYSNSIKILYLGRLTDFMAQLKQFVHLNFASKNVARRASYCWRWRKNVRM